MIKTITVITSVPLNKNNNFHTVVYITYGQGLLTLRYGIGTDDRAIIKNKYATPTSCDAWGPSVSV